MSENKDEKGEREGKIIGVLVINIPIEVKEEIRIVKGIRTDCYSNEEKVVDIQYIFKKHTDGEYSLQLLNGPTGYESFYIEGSLQKHIIKRVGWVACAGTEPIGPYGGWDKLFIPYRQMKKIYDHALELGIIKEN